MHTHTLGDNFRWTWCLALILFLHLFQSCASSEDSLQFFIFWLTLSYHLFFRRPLFHFLFLVSSLSVLDHVLNACQLNYSYFIFINCTSFVIYHETECIFWSYGISRFQHSASLIWTSVPDVYQDILKHCWSRIFLVTCVLFGTQPVVSKECHHVLIYMHFVILNVILCM